MRMLPVLLMCLTLGACSGSTSLSIRSDQAVIRPQVRTAVYRVIDQNTADVYLSDFPPESIVQRLAGVAGEPGTIVHLHLFLAPKAGKTPIDFTASNSAVTCAVFTGDSLGVYGGGGFVLPWSRFGDASLEARVRDATVRLSDQHPGFGDRLGNAWVEGDFEARRDDELAASISDALTRILLK